MRVSRRKLLQSGTAAAAGTALLRGGPAPKSLQIGPSLYESIGVTPIVNCRGTFTIITGSLTLPEVKKAMDEASRHYVHMDELMEAVGRRLAELTKCEWGIVTAGCAAALTHATLACVAGANPERMQRVPKLAGMKNEVIIPKHSRNVYDHAVRMTGVNIVEVSTSVELETSINTRTAMIMIMTSPSADSGPLSTANVCRIANARGVPVLVDAAAERLTIPNKHLGLGATMVTYSGGKCLRGPQSAGLLLGRKELVQAAWINSAPHHAFGRSLKVGKEEIMGMLAAVEAWVTRDHDAEWKVWEAWLATIRDQATKVATVKTEVLQPRGPSNYAPELRITWDTAKVGIGGMEAAEALLEGQPRVVITGGQNSLTVMPYMMMPGDDAIAARRIREVLSNPQRKEKPAPGASNVSIAGQ